MFPGAHLGNLGCKGGAKGYYTDIIDNYSLQVAAAPFAREKVAHNRSCRRYCLLLAVPWRYLENCKDWGYSLENGGNDTGGSHPVSLIPKAVGAVRLRAPKPTASGPKTINKCRL